MSKNSIGTLAYLLPCQQCSEIRKGTENPVHVHNSCIPDGRGLKSSDVSLHLGRHIYEMIYHQKWPQLHKSSAKTPTSSGASGLRDFYLQDSSRMVLEPSPQLRAGNRIWKQWVSPILFLHFCSQYVLKTCYVAGTIVSTEDAALNKTASHPHQVGTISISIFQENQDAE